MAEMVFYQLPADFKGFNEYNRTNLTEQYQIRNVQSLCLQYRSKFVWFLGSKGRTEIMKLDMEHGFLAQVKKIAAINKTVKKIESIQILPNGRCLLLKSDAGTIYPLMTDTLNLLEPLEVSLEGSVIFNLPNVNECLIAQFHENAIGLRRIVLQGGPNEFLFNESTTRMNNMAPSAEDSSGKLHWLYNFYWIYVKFPCQNVFSDLMEKISVKVYAGTQPITYVKHVNEILQKVVDRLKTTKKPIELLVPEANNPTYHNISSMESLPRLKKLGDFVMLLISFTPLQVARCQDNAFLVLRKGEALPSELFKNVFELKREVDLGLYEAVFNNWLGPVKVISSMGKQSSGKSYLLNHLMGSSFNISGSRWLLDDNCYSQ